MHRARRSTLVLVFVFALMLAVSGCGRERRDEAGPGLGGGPSTTSQQTTPQGGVPETAVGETLATKNTQRISVNDPTALAAAVARAVYPGDQRPPAVALADTGDWRAALVGAVLMAPPLRAPMLLTDQGEIPGPTTAAIDALRPKGAPEAAGAQAIRLAIAGDPGGGLRTAAIAGADPFTLAANVAEYRARAARRYSRSVVVVPADDPGFALPAAAWAAKSGDPILFAARRTLPGPTRRALRAHGKPRIYLLGPRAAVSRSVETQLGKLGTVTRITGASPQTTAIAFARFIDAGFGWGIVDPGHGLVFSNPLRPQATAVAAPLSASGSYGPLLLVDDDAGLPRSVRDYLQDIRPGYSSDPVRGVYNHAWIVGEQDAISLDAQAAIDGLLEIAPVKGAGQSP